MAQQVEHVLGKDEVTGSNPVSSSMIADEKAARQKPMKNNTFFMGFFYFKRRKCTFLKRGAEIKFYGCF